MNFKKALIIVSAILVPSIGWGGGGWVPGKGQGYFKLSQSMIRADRYYNPGGDIIDITTVSLYTTSLYGEYGLTSKFAATLYFPFFVRTTLNDVRFRQSGEILPGDALNSLGDIDVGLKYGFIQDGPVKLSASVILGLPVGEDQGGDSRILQTGDGEFNQQLQLEASYPFPNSSFYVSVLGGFNNRTNGFSDEILYGLELGYSQKTFSTMVKVRGVNSLKNGDASGAAGNTIFSNNTEYISITPEINYHVRDHWGLSVSSGFAVSGRNILASPNFSFGVFLTL